MTKSQAYLKPSSFVKWAGGKKRLLDSILPAFKNLGEGTYVEPFLGSGALALAILSNKIGTGKVVLADSNQHLISAWRTIFKSPSDLLTMLSDYKQKHSKDFYYETRALDRDPSTFQSLTELEIAARFIYLNKSCFNGLWRVNSKGQNNVPIGSYKDPNICDRDSIMNVHDILTKSDREVIILNADYEEVIDTHAKPGDMIYLDPPYVPCSSTSNFTGYTTEGFSDVDQKNLADKVRCLQGKGILCIVSNSNTERTRELYCFTKLMELDITYAVGAKSSSRKKNSELLIGDI